MRPAPRQFDATGTALTVRSIVVWPSTRVPMYTTAVWPGRDADERLVRPDDQLEFARNAACRRNATGARSTARSRNVARSAKATATAGLFAHSHDLRDRRHRVGVCTDLHLALERQSPDARGHAPPT